MTQVQKLSGIEGSRVETGPLQFGDDWPGVFIRGDNAFAVALALAEAIKHLPTDRYDLYSILSGHLKTLQSCKVERP